MITAKIHEADDAIEIMTYISENNVTVVDEPVKFDNPLDILMNDKNELTIEEIQKRIAEDKKEHWEEVKRQREIEAARKKVCPKCSGQDRISGYAHVANGICFRCGGSGTIK